MSNFVVSRVPADGLTQVNARASAGTAMAKFKSSTYTDRFDEGGVSLLRVLKKPKLMLVVTHCPTGEMVEIKGVISEHALWIKLMGTSFGIALRLNATQHRCW